MYCRCTVFDTVYILKVFKTRAAIIEKALRAEESNVEVVINAQRPRRGSFVLTAAREGKEEKVFLELLDMPRPFTKLKAVDFSGIPYTYCIYITL